MDLSRGKSPANNTVAMAEIEHISIVPNYNRGFTFSWVVSRELSDPAPWTFIVQSGMSYDGPWSDLSIPLINQYAWQQPERMLAPKDPVLYFRVKMVTPSATYYSDIRSPYSDLSRAEFLQAREIMRNEVVQARLKTGVECYIWSKAVIGPKCTSCTDPVTGAVIDPDCSECYGTGVIPGYHGPYDAWAVFTPSNRDKGLKGDNLGVHEDYAYGVRMVGCPIVKKDDVLIDTRSDKRYYINRVQNLFELRRVPLVQQIEAREAPTSANIYNLGE